jgi:transposase
MNEIRGLLAECGVIAAQGASALRRLIATVTAEPDQRVSDLLREILLEMSERLRLFEEHLKRYDRRITEIAHKERTNRPINGGTRSRPADCHRADRRRRQYAAVPQWKRTSRMLVPRQHTRVAIGVTLLGISKRGDRYLVPC